MINNNSSDSVGLSGGIVNERSIEKEDNKQIKESVREKMGGVILKRNNFLFECNYVTGEITKLDFSRAAKDRRIEERKGTFVVGENVLADKKRLTIDDANSVVSKPLQVKENCIYIPSLNEKNARKKFKRWMAYKKMSYIWD